MRIMTLKWWEAEEGRHTSFAHQLAGWQDRDVRSPEYARGHGERVRSSSLQRAGRGLDGGRYIDV